VKSSTLKHLKIVTALALTYGASISHANDLSYDYIELSAVESQVYEDGATMDGYKLDFSYQFGNHFSFLLGFDNVNDKQSLANLDYEQRVKTKHFGFGFRSSVSENLDFVAQYTNDDYRYTEIETDNLGTDKFTYKDDGDTIRIGLRGLLGEKFEWDAFGVRKTLNGDGVDVDDSGYQLSLRYRLAEELSLGMSRSDIGDFEETALSLRYTF